MRTGTRAQRRRFDRYVVGTIGTGPVLGYFTLSKDSYVSIGIYPKTDTAPKLLLREIMTVKWLKKGTWKVAWDGLDEDGNPVTDYEAWYQSNQMTATFDTIGNNSDLIHGPTTWNGYARIRDMVKSSPIIYVGKNYDEASGEGLRKIDTSISYHKKYPVLNWDEPGNTGGRNYNDTNVETQNLAENSDTVFIGSSSGDDSFIWAIDKATGAEKVFAGTGIDTYDKAGGRFYGWVNDLVTGDPTDYIDGVAANDTYVWVFRPTQNKIKIYSAVDLGYIGEVTGYTKPRRGEYDSYRNIVYFQREFGSNPSNMVRGEINNANGQLSTGFMTISDFPTNKGRMAICNVYHRLYIIDEYNNFVAYWNIAHASNPSGTRISNLGAANWPEPSVSEKKFSLKDNTSTMTEGLTEAFVCIDQQNGDIFVGDAGNERVQQFDFNETYIRSFINQPAVYSTSVDINNPDRVFVGLLEFSRSTKELVKNWRPSLGQDYFFKEMYNAFKWCATINGITHASLVNVDAGLVEMVHLDDSNGIVPTGVFLNDDGFVGVLDKDFNKLYLTCPTDYNPGAIVTVNKKDVSIDGDGIISWGAAYPIGTFEIEAGDAVENADAFAQGAASLAGITDSGLIIIKNVSPSYTASCHIQAFSLATGKRVFKQALPTTNEEVNPPHPGHIGPRYVSPKYWETGNSVNNVAEGGVRVVKNLLVWLNNAENWHEGGQAFIWNITGHLGLSIFQWGDTGWNAEAVEQSPLNYAGNCISWSCIIDPAEPNKLKCIGNDESKHAAGILVEFDKINTISYKRIDLLPPPTDDEEEGIPLLDEVIFNSILENTPNITFEGLTAGAAAYSGANRYQVEEKEISLMLVPSDVVDNTILTSRIKIPPSEINALQKKNKIKFYGSFNNHAGADTDGPTALFKYTDTDHKIITQITLEKTPVVDIFDLKIGDTKILTFNDPNTLRNIVYQWQLITIEVDSSGCLVTYGDIGPILVDFFDPTCTWNSPNEVIAEVVKFTSEDGNYRAIAIDNSLRYVDYEVLPAPEILYLKATSKFKIIGLFNQIVTDHSLTGFILKDGDTELTKSSISGSGHEFEIIVSDEMLQESNLTAAYVLQEGENINESSVELQSFSPIEITNEIPIPEDFEYIMPTIVNSSGGYSTDIASDTFNTEAGTTVLFAVKFAGYVTINSIDVNSGELPVLDKIYTIGNIRIAFYRISNIGAYTGNKITVNFSGMNNYKVLYVNQLRGLYLSLPVDTTFGNSSNSSLNVNSGAITSVGAPTYLIGMIANEYLAQTFISPIGVNDLAEDVDQRTRLIDRQNEALVVGEILTATRSNPDGDFAFVGVLYSKQ